MSTQVFLASTAFGLATLAAALDEGHFAPAGRRILVLTNDAGMPEATPGLDQVAGWAALRSRFDTVVDHNAALAPLHPAGWVPRSPELPIWERYLRGVWGVGDEPVHLVLESIQASPALALARVFSGASIDVYADGLMSYGPTRTVLPDDVGWRVERLLHLDLAPGLTPMLLADWDVPPVLISASAFRSVIAELTPQRPPTAPAVLVLGQYLAALGLVTHAEELELYRQLVAAAGARHPHRVVFKPHPSAPLGQRAGLRSFAAAAGVELEISTGLELAESWFATGSVLEVVGCFSTALATAAHVYGLPVARHGTDLLLRRMTPFQNSNRIPATIVDASFPGTSGDPDAAPPIPRSELRSLVTAVGYAMQPIRYAEHRGAAVVFLTRHPELHGRYFKRRRLTRLDLPGRLPPRGQLERLGRAGLGQLRARVFATAEVGRSTARPPVRAVEIRARPLPVLGQARSTTAPASGCTSPPPAGPEPDAPGAPRSGS